MKDLYQELLEFYRFKVGVMPMEELLLAALKQTVTPEELRIFFMLPFSGYIIEEELLRKAEETGVQKDKLEIIMKHLAMESLVLVYSVAEGQAYERGNIIYMTEQQVRKKNDFPAKRMFAELYGVLTDGFDAAPKTSPNFRAMPVESTITTEPGMGTYEVNIPVADPRAVLPLDIVSDIVKKQPLIAIADCYCRMARKIRGKECEHPLETCFAFNEFAEALINAGTGREINVDEALDILYKCEQAGLVHFIDNVESHPKVLCNCCECACPVLKLTRNGNYTGGGPSRFIISFDEQRCVQQGLCESVCPMKALRLTSSGLIVNSERCIGCGLCVSHCPEGALRLVPRENYPRIYPTRDALDEQIKNEIEELMKGKE